MSDLNPSEQKPSSASTQNIQRAIWIVLAILVVVVVAFVGYYIWDRYIHLGDESPIDLGVRHLEDAVREDPQNVDARVALAEYYLAGGQYADARDQANQVLNTYPQNESALLIAGIAHVRLGDPEAALAPLERFIVLRKDRPMANVDATLETAYYFVGESYVRLNRPDEAIPALEAALVIKPTDADALYQVGLAYQASGQAETALERYHKAVRMVPDFAEVYEAMIVSYSALGKADHEAYARGMAAYSLQEYEDALPHLEQATSALPDFGPAFLGLGLTYEKMGQLEAALEAVQQALEINPGDFVAQQALGRIQSILDQ